MCPNRGGPKIHYWELESKLCRRKGRKEGLCREEGEWRTQRDTLDLLDDEDLG